MYKKFSIALLILTLLLSGCAAANLQSARDSGEVTTQNIEAPAPAAAPELYSYAGSKSAYSIDQTAASADRLVIKNASLSMAVNDPLKSMDTISHMAESMGGFVVNADMYQQTLNNGVKVPQVSMTIRVPAEKLDQALASIKQETDQPIISENETSQDVTAEYTDLNSRLTNLQAAEKQLQEIMASATKTEDVLSVYSQLVSVREQIELIKGQMKYYEQSAALSSISIQQSLANFGIRMALLYLPTLLVIFVPIGLIVWGIVALIRRARKPKVAITPTPGV
jgi:hypothetical protein